MSLYWHYTSRTALDKAVRTDGFRPVQKHPVLLFAPQTIWVPTFFLPGSEGAVRCATEQEMRSRGLYRIGLTESQLMPVAQARLHPGVSRTTLDAELAVLADMGVDTTRWRALVGGFNFCDVIINRYDDGHWNRIKRMKRLVTFGLIALHEEPLEPDDRGANQLD